MPRPTLEYKHWTAIKAGIVEHQRYLTKSSELDKLQPAHDAPEFAARVIYPSMACVSPSPSWVEFCDMEPEDVYMLADIAWQLNPTWKPVIESDEVKEKKSAENTSEITTA